ncbi:MAG: hypothetical protein R6U19_03630 [Bacteroidales bacterium]
MKKPLFLICTLLIMTSLGAQQISVSALGNTDQNLITKANVFTRYDMTSELGTGFSFRVSVAQLRVFNWPIGLGLGYHELSSDLQTSGGGLGGGGNRNLTYQKQLISFAVFPLCFSRNNFHLNFGLAGTRLMNETYEGDVRGWSMGSGDTTYTIDESFSDVNNEYNFGLNISAYYNIPLYKGFGISPYLSTFVGFSPEVEAYDLLKGSPLRFFGGLSFYWKFRNRAEAS